MQRLQSFQKVSYGIIKDIDIGNLFSILAKCAVKTNRNVGL